MRIQHAYEQGEPAVEADLDDEDLEDSDADEDEQFERPAPQYRQPKPAPRYKTGTRQPAAKAATITGELPWWAKVPLGGMTSAATTELPRMKRSKEGHRVKSYVND
jgi:hypothetical protein